MVNPSPGRRTRPAHRPRVLYVDDQIGNLTAFRASLRRFADIQTATSGEEALTLLEHQEFPVVISDQRMTGMNGSEFLAKVRELQPSSIRILLTAYADFAGVVSAINDGQISRIVQKPWDRDEMCAIIAHSARLHQSLKENQALSRHIIALDRQVTAGQVASAVVDQIAHSMDQAGDDNAQGLDDIVDGSTDLLMRIRGYAQAQIEDEPLRSEIGLNQVVETAVSLVAPLTPDGATITPKLAEQTPIVSLDRHETCQLLIHLLKSATCIRPGAQISISTGIEDKGPYVEMGEVSYSVYEALVGELERHGGVTPSLVVMRRLLERQSATLAWCGDDNAPEAAMRVYFASVAPLVA